jgi:hypothetical protein
MNKNAFSKKEGIVMNSKLYFGDPIPVFSQFKHFLVLEQTMFDMRFHYYYRITDDNYIQMARGYEDKEHTICAQYKCTHQDLKNNLKHILSKYIEANRFFNGYPNFISGTLFTESEFLNLIKDDKMIPKNKESPFRTSFIDFLEKMNFNPKPTGNNEYSWTIGCPNAEGKHFLMISTLNDEWGCGYCNRKGNLEDFKNWLRELDRKKLTQFVKEINTDNDLSDKMKKWWFNRY